MYLIWAEGQSNLETWFIIIRSMNQIISMFSLNYYLMMNALEYNRFNDTLNLCILRFNNIDILRSDNNLNILVFLEAFIYTFKIFSLPTIAKLREQKEVCIIHLFGKVGKPREKGFSLKVEGLEIIKLKGLGLPLAETKKNKKEKLQNGENQKE